jgi:eukaryotic-like serine/threonine-protein kinase
MKVGDDILGYKLTTTGSASGGGRCMWSFAERDGKEYFVKRFLSPKYPTDDAPGTPSSKARAREKSAHFEASQNEIMGAIQKKTGSGGSVVAPIRFGRVGPTFYKVYEKVDVATAKPADVARMSPSNRMLILRVIAHSVGILHRERIVHGDLKPDNILIKQTKPGVFTAKLIDFDDSYFEGRVPEPETIVGDPAHYSPELLDFIVSADPSKGARVTTKSDIYAMGLVFSQYLTGKLPPFDTAKFTSAAACTLFGLGFSTLKTGVEEGLDELIRRMLARDPASRPSAADVLVELKVKGPITGIATSLAASKAASPTLHMKKPSAPATPVSTPVASPAPSTESKTKLYIRPRDKKR